MSNSNPTRSGWRGWLIGNAAKENQRLKSLPVAKVQTRADVLFAYKMRMGIGLLLMVGGAGVSLGTYLFPSGGGVYYVFWGVVVWGGIVFFRGLDGWLEARPRCSQRQNLETHYLDECSHSQHMMDLWRQRHERKRRRKTGKLKTN